jgi:Flp pilus assembly pilin Flp
MMNATVRAPVISIRRSYIGNPSSEFIMIEFVKTWLELKIDRRAVTALEYGLIAGVIVATITVGFSLLANSLSKSFSTIGGSL